jgi:hypothetical protein
MTTQPRGFKSILGKRLGLGAYGQIATNGINLSQPAVDATISISAEGATTGDTRDITIQLKDAHGQAIDYAENFEIIMYSSSAMTDFVAAGGSTGVQQGATGKLLAIVAKKVFACITSTAGAWAGSYLDTGTAAGYLAVRLPNGRVIGGGTVTNA